jgi:hypothetical protein
VNYANHQAMVEAWNANLWNHVFGLVLRMSPPAWHSTVWQTYDFDVNGAYCGSHSACEPLPFQADAVTWRHELTVSVRNRGSAVAVMVRLSLLDDKTGRRLLPTLCSDNYLWLLPVSPGRCACPGWRAALTSGRPAVRLEPYIGPAATMRA